MVVVIGRLIGKLGVCFVILGLGILNLVIGFVIVNVESDFVVVLVGVVLCMDWLKCMY